MNTDLSLAASHLAKAQLLRLENGRGLRILNLSGRLWLTQEGEARDTVLEAGEEVAIARDGLSVLMALQDASFLVLQPQLLKPPVAPAVKASAAKPLAPWWAMRWSWL